MGVFVSVEFCGYVFVGQSLCVCVSVCSSADSHNFVYVTPVVFFFSPGEGYVCVCTSSVLALVDLKGGRICGCLSWGSWWRLRGVHFPPGFLSRLLASPHRPQSLWEVIWLHTGIDRCWSLGWGAGPQAGLLKGSPQTGPLLLLLILQLAEQGTGVADWSWDQPGTRRPDLAGSPRPGWESSRSPT